jgi:hypothetical protein
MAMYEYGIGTSDIKPDVNEAVKEIQQNKPLLISQLTHEEPILPEAVPGLKTIGDVFRYFQPNVDVQLETADGQTVTENLKFNNLADFTHASITNQSALLKDFKLRQEQFTKIIRQLRSNKVLQNVLADPEKKAALLQALGLMSADLRR